MSCLLACIVTSSVSATENNKTISYIEMSTESWTFSLPDSWEPKKTEGGIRADSEDGVQAVFISTYLISEDLSPSEWAENNIKIVKEAKYSAPDNSFEFYIEKVELKQDIQTFELDGYDKTNSFRIYTKHYRIGNVLVTLSFHDYWCESYKASERLSNELLSKFRINT